MQIPLERARLVAAERPGLLVKSSEAMLRAAQLARAEDEAQAQARAEAMAKAAQAAPPGSGVLPPRR